MPNSHSPASLDAIKFPSLSEAAKTYFKVGVLSFGGPAGQIALMHKIFVEENKWLDEKQYLNALSFCMLLPGPEAMQLATYIGWRLHGTVGGIIAGGLFVIPGAVVIFLLALLYVYFGELSWVSAAFQGVKAAVLVVVIEALLRVSKRALRTRLHWLIAGMAFIGIFVFDLPYPAIVIVAAALGFLSVSSKAKPVEELSNPLKATWTKTLATIFTWLVIWFAPLIGIGFAGDWDPLFQIGIFFSKLATVTFGGAYAVLAYMSQQVITELGWLTTTQMMDGLGLAETTPGPLILVTEFVGFLAGFKNGGLGWATLSALLVLWVTFIPCFLWIFAGAPYIEWITAQPKLKGALSAITAAVVGVILSLSLWFGLHVLFDQVDNIKVGVINIWAPDFLSLNLVTFALSILSFYLLLIRNWNIIYVIVTCAWLGFVINFFL